MIASAFATFPEANWANIFVKHTARKTYAYKSKDRTPANWSEK